MFTLYILISAVDVVLTSQLLNVNQIQLIALYVPCFQSQISIFDLDFYVSLALKRHRNPDQRLRFDEKVSLTRDPWDWDRRWSLYDISNVVASTNMSWIKYQILFVNQSLYFCWCRLCYSVRNSLVALLEALFDRLHLTHSYPFFDLSVDASLTNKILYVKSNTIFAYYALRLMTLQM